jgi:excisionase family DNA binding protein
MKRVNYLTVKDVAEKFGRSTRRVTQWIQAGKLPATLIGGVYLIHPADVEKFQPGKPGWPVGKPSPRRASD